jgi:lambda family phage tail tape measure protein
VSAGSARASRSIDNYIKKLQTAAATNGMSTRESELYTLSLKGASKAQLEAADSALKMSEGYQKGIDIGQRLRTGFIALAAAAGAAAVATYAGTIALINQVGKYQDLAEKIGDTAVNVSSLKTASDVSGTSIDTIATASVKLTAALSKTDDESKLVGGAIKALGLNFEQFKKQSPVEQLQTVARAFGEFADGSEKTAVAVSLFGKSGAELLGFLKEYADEGLNAAYVTAEQAKAADDYSDAQARLKSQLEQFLQVTAVNAIPVLTEIGDLFKTIGKEQQGTSDATGIIKGAINALVVVFQALVVVGSDVVFVFQSVYKEVEATVQQLIALARLDFSGFTAISKAVEDDTARARASLDKFQARVMSIGEKNVEEPEWMKAVNAAGVAIRPIDARTRLKPPRDGSGKGRKDNTAAQEAKAQLALDLEEIKKEQAALANTLGNSEKLISAQRSANLISEGDYYAKKRELLQADIAAQESAAQKEIARLQQENLSGKDKIDNDRKIVDAQAKLAKLRENATSNLQVLAIQEKDSLDSIARAYVDARTAAQSYLDVTNRARQLELDSMGQGTKTRDFGAAISQITEKYEQQRQDLQRDNRNGKFAGRQEDFQRELALLNEFQAKSIASYSDYYAKLTEKQGSFALGASEALKNYYDESQNVFKQTEEAVGSAFKGMEDAIIEFAKTGKLSVKSLVDSILTDIARIVIKQQITGPLAGLLGGLFSGGKSGPSASEMGVFDTFISGLAGRAIGGPVSAGGMYRVNENGPEMLTAGGKDYLMMGSQGGSVSPNSGTGAPVNIVINNTVGDVATMSMLKQSQQGTERRIAAALGRSRSYGGAAA